MSRAINRKPIPRSVLIFGAGQHIGNPLARFLQREAPQVRLRLASSRLEGCVALRRDFPHAEVVEANYLEPASLDAAMAGMEGIFYITSGPIDEEEATVNFIAAAKSHIGQFHTSNDGQDLLRYSDAAWIMTEVFGEPIIHDGSREAFFKYHADRMGTARATYLWNFFECERDNEVVWALNAFVEGMFGRKPVTLRAWAAEHRKELLG